MIVLIDNYDSFVYNLARYLERLGQETRVVRNDAVTVDELRAWPIDAVVLSPGPCAPLQAGICLDLVRRCHDVVPILGICLGHQAIAQGLGGRVIRAVQPMHGRSSPIHHAGCDLFQGLPSPTSVGRYHSLVVERETLPDALQVTAATEDGTIMAFQHQRFPVFGLQFHPESVLTPHGYTLLRNFLRAIGLETTPEPVDELRPRFGQASMPQSERGFDPRQAPEAWMAHRSLVPEAPVSALETNETKSP